ncbi:MAG: dTDP-4-dehydrorhamnose reductase [Alcanivorax sp.]|jgi:dTDP-4-dehydrorhamnose reductase
MVKILVTGAAGQVGSELLKLASSDFDLVGYNSSELDITNSEQVQQIVAKESPALIINAAAYTAVDKAEGDAKRAFAVNEAGVKNLVQAALALNIPIFHISTDYVFDGKSSVPYKEMDPVGPTGVYGASKLGGEQVLANSGVEYIVLRTSWVFGAQGNNFVKTMLRLGQERETLGVVADQYGCPTSAKSIANLIWDLTNRYFQFGSLKWGVYNFNNMAPCSWCDFADEIFQQAKVLGLVDQNFIVKPINTSEFPTKAKRPMYSVLDTEKIIKSYGVVIPKWKDELNSVLNEIIAVA